MSELGAFAKADLDFHHALAEAAGNEALTDHVHVIRSLLQVYADRAVQDASHAERAVAEHEAILGAVRAEDADACGIRYGRAHGDGECTPARRCHRDGCEGRVVKARFVPACETRYDG